MAGATAILALDMYEHSYHIEYGAAAAEVRRCLHGKQQLDERRAPSSGARAMKEKFAMKLRFLIYVVTLVAVIAALTVPVVARAADPDWKAVEQALGRSGQMQPGVRPGHVIESRRERVNVFSVDGSHERLIQQRHHLARHLVAQVLEVLDGLRLRRLIAEHIDEVVEPPARVHEIGRLAFEAIEEPLFARNEPDHARVPQSGYRRRSAAAGSEHGAPGRRPNIHAHFVGRQREDGLDTLPARSPEANRSTLIADIPFPAPWKRRSQAMRERKTSVLRACRVPNPANRLNVVQRPKSLFESQRSMTSRS